MAYKGNKRIAAVIYNGKKLVIGKFIRYLPLLVADTGYNITTHDGMNIILNTPCIITENEANGLTYNIKTSVSKFRMEDNTVIIGGE